jgi:uncharacterized protein (TIGR03437 family)
LAVSCAFCAFGQTRYELQAGGTIPLAEPPETVNFLLHAKSRQFDLAGGGLTAGPNRAGDRILLAASLLMNPGEYTVKLTAASAAGEERQITMAVVVKPRTTVPVGSTRPPVVLLNGWETGFTGSCPVSTDSSEAFGNLADYLVADGVPVVYFFDNCAVDPNQSIEQLGVDLGAVLNSIQYDNGAQVPQIDLVGFSMGGLIARAYLAGLQPITEVLTPPTPTLVRDLVLIATPNFGSFVAGNYAAAVVPGSQSAELEPGSALLWNLATWNQRNDDLRGVNAISVIGNFGNYTPSISSSVVIANFSDGLVSMTSASGGFVVPAPLVTVPTRIVPYCHVDPSAFTNPGFGAFACNAGGTGIANVTSTSQETGEIVRSFLGGTTAWQSIGTSPATDQYLSAHGALNFALVNAADSYVTDMTAVTFGGLGLVNGGDTGTIFYGEFLAGTGALEAESASIGAVGCETYAETAAAATLGYTSTVRCKLGPNIFSVGPLTGTGGRAVNAGSAITIVGSGFGTQCSVCVVRAIPANSTAPKQLTVSAWSNTSITAALPAGLTGLLNIEVTAAAGTDIIGVIAIPPSTLSVSPGSLQFAYTTGAATPAAQSIQITNSGSGTLAWSATASTSANAAWLSVSPSSGTAPSALTVSVSPAGLNPGTYTGAIRITGTGASNSPASIGVTLTVTQAVPSLAVTPQALTFQYTNGGAVPAAQNVTITNAGGGALAWTASTSNGGYWLGVSAGSGSAPATLAVSVNPVNLAAGSYTGSVQITAVGANGSPAAVSVTLVVTGTQPAPTIAGFGNGASFQPAFAGATWVSIVGTNLSQTTYTWQGSDFVNGQLPTILDGVSVSIDGIPAYVEYISPTQINVLAPDDAKVGAVQVQVNVAQQNSNSLSAQKAQFAPAFFTFGDGYVAARHVDYSLVGAPNLFPGGAATTPAQPGQTILLYGTGFGPTNPAVPTGQLVATPEQLANSVQVSIGGMNAPVTFGGLSGSGLYQFNVTVPNLPNGDAAVLATIGGVTTQAGVSVTVQQ